MNNRQKVSFEIDSTLRQKLHVFITMTYGAGQDIVEHMDRALLEYMENHMSEFDDKMQERCCHDIRGINDVVAVEE